MCTYTNCPYSINYIVYEPPFKLQVVLRLDIHKNGPSTVQYYALQRTAREVNLKMYAFYEWMVQAHNL